MFYGNAAENFSFDLPQQWRPIPRHWRHIKIYVTNRKNEYVICAAYVPEQI